MIYSATDQNVALDYLRRSAKLRETLPGRHELAETYVSIAQLLAGDEATAYLKQAIDLLEPHRNPSAWATAYRRLVERLHGDELASFRRNHDATARALGLEIVTNRGAEVVTGVSREELEKLHSLVMLDEGGTYGVILEAPQERYRTPEYGWRSRLSKASVLWDIGQRTEALAEMYAALEEIDKMRNAYQTEDERRQYLANQWMVYDNTICYLIQEGRFDEALEVVERVKARSLLDLVGTLDYVPESVPAELRGSYREAMLRLRRQGKETRERIGQVLEGDSKGLEAAKADWVAAMARVDMIVEEVKRYAPEFDPLSPIPPVQRGSLLSLIQNTSHIIVVFWIGRQAQGAFLLSSGGIRFERLPRVEELAGILDEYRESLTMVSTAGLQRHLGVGGGPVPRLISGRLSQHLLAPLERHLEQPEIQRITFIPHHYLHIVPLHALEVKGRRLLDQYTIDYCPSLSLLALCRQRLGGGLVIRHPLVIGNPDGSLLAAEIEAEAVSSMFDSALLLRGPEASLVSLLSNIDDRSCLHFACHGRSGRHQEEDFALLLAPTRNHTGLLSAGQIISHVRIVPGSLVVLSACSTAQTVLGETDEYVGLVGAFLLSGASRVVASLWPVDDISAALFMWKFYHNLLETSSINESLNAAQIWLRSLPAGEAASIFGAWRAGTSDLARQGKYDALVSRFEEHTGRPFEDPFFWAAFVCVGPANPKGLGVLRTGMKRFYLKIAWAKWAGARSRCPSVVADTCLAAMKSYHECLAERGQVSTVG